MISKQPAITTALALACFLLLVLAAVQHKTNSELRGRIDMIRKWADEENHELPSELALPPVPNEESEPPAPTPTPRPAPDRNASEAASQTDRPPRKRREMLDPAKEIERLEKELQRALDAPLAPTSGVLETPTIATAFIPRLDAREVSGRYVVKVDLPGTAREHIAVELQGRTLTISGRRETWNAEDGNDAFQQERSSGVFHRSLILPGPVDPGQAQARYDRGVLTVTLPKAEKGSLMPQMIEVQ